MPQSFSRVIVHAVFSTKQRVPNLVPEVRQRLHPFIGGILRDLDCQPLATGGVADHVHALFALSRNISQAEAMKQVKAGSSRWLSETWPELGQFSWQQGYAISSVDARNPEDAIRYVQNQESHHRNVPFLHELREMLESLGFELEERDL